MTLNHILPGILADSALHCRWLNTLSMMENCGAKKIAACQHPVFVNEIILKHASEEFRHAYYLKKQLGKLQPSACPTYEFDYLLAAAASHRYLDKLDLQSCRYLKNTLGLEGPELKYAAYLFVTYAIEVRADELYPVYQDLLSSAGSKVNVKSIIMEEENHLAEMLTALKEFNNDWESHAAEICRIENELFAEWILALQAELIPQQSH